MDSIRTRVALQVVVRVNARSAFTSDLARLAPEGGVSAGGKGTTLKRVYHFHRSD